MFINIFDIHFYLFLMNIAKLSQVKALPLLAQPTKPNIPN